MLQKEQREIGLKAVAKLKIKLTRYLKLIMLQ